MKRERLDICLGANLKARAIAYSASQGLSAGAYARQALERDLLKVDPSLAPLVKSVPMRNKEEIVQFTIGLTVSEKGALEHRADLMGCSQSRLVVCGLRTFLTEEPQPFPAEIEELKESNYLLSSIARDMNRVARALEAGNVPADMSALKGMFLHLKAHTKKMDRKMKASVERWFLR